MRTFESHAAGHRCIALHELYDDMFDDMHDTRQFIEIPRGGTGSRSFLRARPSERVSPSERVIAIRVGFGLGPD
jgi:hypothetical protein